MFTSLAVVSGPRETNEGGICMVSSVAADIEGTGIYYQLD